MKKRILSLILVFSLIFPTVAFLTRASASVESPALAYLTNDSAKKFLRFLSANGGYTPDNNDIFYSLITGRRAGFEDEEDVKIAFIEFVYNSISEDMYSKRLNALKDHLISNEVPKTLMEASVEIVASAAQDELVESFTSIQDYGDYWDGMKAILYAIVAVVNIRGAAECQYFKSLLGVDQSTSYYDIIVDGVSASVAGQGVNRALLNEWLDFMYLLECDVLGNVEIASGHNYQITFDSNCNNVDTISYVYDPTQDNWYVPELEREDYIFCGWYWDSACTISAAGTITINQDLTFYAKWVPQFKYTVSNNQVTITGLAYYKVVDNVKITDIVIPETIDGYKVTAIGNSAFHNNTDLTSISIPNTVTSIGSSAFSGCSALTSIIIPNGVTSLDGAFRGCTSLTNINIPDSVTSLYGAFRGCTSLTNINIPDSVTSLNCTFISCSALTSITIPNSVTSLASTFMNCRSLESVNIPNGVTTLNSTFSGCSALKSIVIPDSVTYIGDSVFENCTSLTSITIPDSVTQISSHAFDGCSYFENASNWENNVLYIGNHLIAVNSSLDGTLKIKDGTINIADGAFLRCRSPIKIIIPNSFTSIGLRAFSNCSATSITIPDSVTSIGKYAFAQCTNLSSITIPDSVTSIGAGAFYHSVLTSITIPDGVTRIEDNTFDGCYDLDTITLPESLTYVSTKAFWESGDNKTVFFKGTEDQWENLRWGSDNDAVRSPSQLYCIDGTCQTYSTKIKYDKSSTTASITPHEKYIGKTVVFAMYKDGVLADVKFDVFNGDTLEFSSSAECDTIDVMIWDDLTSLTPARETETITTSFWNS